LITSLDSMKKLYTLDKTKETHFIIDFVQGTILYLRVIVQYIFMSFVIGVKKLLAFLRNFAMFNSGYKFERTHKKNW